MQIYVIVNHETLKIYIGQHKYDDLGKYLSRKFWDANHKGSGKRSHLYASMRKYGRDAWSIHSLVAGIESKKELDETEQLLIYALKSQHPEVGYNICDGGEGFTGEHTEEWKRNQSLLMRRIRTQKFWSHIPTPAEIEKRRQKQIGQKRTPETCKNISNAKKALGHGIGQSHVVSEETKKSIGEKNKAGWTPERRAAWSEYKKVHNGMKGMPAWNRKIVEPRIEL